MDWLWFVVVAVRGVSPDPDDQWATRLAGLDQARAVAFAEGDVSRLDDVYLMGSPAQRQDAATIRAWSARGGRVVGAEIQVISCRVVSSSQTRVELDVVDRLAPAQVVWRDGSRTGLPRDQASRRVVTVVRTGEGWRVAGTEDVS